MFDIYVGIIIVALLIAGLFFSGFYIAKTFRKKISNIVAAITIIFLFVYFCVLDKSRYLYTLIPFSNLIIIGRWGPLIISFFCGLAWEKIPGKSLKKTCYLLPLIIASLYNAYNYFFLPLPKCYNNWQNGICIQTSASTCSAACSATLLKLHGIKTTEKEMAELCLSRKTGTDFYGLLRGLKLKTKGSKWDVEIFQWDFANLKKINTPAIIRISTQNVKSRDLPYERGIRHTLVLLSFLKNGKVELGDPSTGRTMWSADTLKLVWYGQGIRLVKKE